MNLQRIINISKKIFKLPPIPTILISIPSFALVIYVLTNDMENMVISHAAYTLSAYALVITITGMAGIARLIKQGIENCPFIKKVISIPIFEKYLKEAEFRTETSLYQGLFINLLYVVLKFGSGIYYRSIWFGSLAVYYLLLAVMRFSLLHYVRNRKDNRVFEWKRYRFCGIVLLFMNQALTAIVVIVVKQNKGFEYAGFLIYAMALYAFYAVIASVINVVKFRKYGSPITFAVTPQPPNYILCILLAVPGFSGWIFPYFLYKKIVRKQTARVTPLIEEKYDEIYEICEKGNKLLY